MSRIGKQPIVIPEAVKLALVDDVIIVTGPKGELKQKLHPMVTLEIADKEARLLVADPEDKSERSLWGLFGSLVRNMITGVVEGFTKKLDITGVGFKATMNGNDLVLNVGYSHPVNFPVPKGVEIKVEANVITVSGIDKQLVGETAAQIRRVKKVEPYKGKGIKYVGEVVRRKAGKAATKAK